MNGGSGRRDDHEGAGAATRQMRAMIEKLDATVNGIVAARGYTREAKTLKLLRELIREQLIHAHARPATRTIR